MSGSLPLSAEQKELFRTFHADALEFCKTLATYHDVPLGKFLRKVASGLGRIYASGVLLPDVAPATSDDIPDAFSPDDEATLRQALEEKLGRYNTYLEVFDPYEDQHHEPIHGTLADDLSEIYNDLQDVLGAWTDRSGDGCVDLLWNARFQFVHHWGEHATGALRAIDALLNRQFIEATETDA